MPLPPALVHPGVNRNVLLALTLLVSAPLTAAEVDPKLDRAVRAALPVCVGASVTYADSPVKLPARFTGALVKIESPRHSCDGQFIAALGPSGSFYLGSPWPLDRVEGATTEEKLTNFTWTNLQENFTVTVDRTRTIDGLFPVTLVQATEAGKMPMKGMVDADGRLFFPGYFRPAGTEIPAARTKVFEPFLPGSPSKGASSPAVTIVEFSDFQCPSCQRSAGYVDPILAKHGDKVRYVRYDLPLTGHAWAFPAALTGRAIYRQKPEAFWAFKKQVYENQSSLNPFTFWDWARGFATDHELDLARYDADLASEELKTELLNGAGTALSNDIRATPSYMVNGTLVEAGDEGKALAEYVEGLLAK